jgi:hypothetical protein
LLGGSLAALISALDFKLGSDSTSNLLVDAEPLKKELREPLNFDILIKGMDCTAVRSMGSLLISHRFMFGR